MPYVTKKNGDKYCVYKKGSSSSLKCYSDKKDADKYRDALNINVKSMAVAISEVIASEAAANSAITALMDTAPQLTVVHDVEIVKTGIEYPLSTGPTTFTPEDLAEAVAAVDDPAISTPRIWLGHPDDPRIHGKRADGGPPSGEPAVGRVTNMRLAEEGNCIVGDLEGVPLWLARIMGSAYPSRSIEANFDVKTVTNHDWRLVITGLALLGVCWPGVSTLEDIASLFTEEGPDNVEVIEATKETPVTILANQEGQIVEGQMTVEDVRREWYDNLTAEQQWWWIRAMYLNPNELIVCDDDSGDLYRQTFKVSGEAVSFGDPEQVKIEYVAANNGGIAPKTINEGRQRIAAYADRAESRPENEGGESASPNNVINFPLKGSYVTFKIQKEDAS